MYFLHALFWISVCIFFLNNSIDIIVSTDLSSRKRNGYRKRNWTENNHCWKSLRKREFNIKLEYFKNIIKQRLNSKY